jgi:hypothetical protein
MLLELISSPFLLWGRAVCRHHGPPDHPPLWWGWHSCWDQEEQSYSTLDDRQDRPLWDQQNTGSPRNHNPSHAHRREESSDSQDGSDGGAQSTNSSQNWILFFNLGGSKWAGRLEASRWERIESRPECSPDASVTQSVIGREQGSRSLVNRFPRRISLSELISSKSHDPCGKTKDFRKQRERGARS